MHAYCLNACFFDFHVCTLNEVSMRPCIYACVSFWLRSLVACNNMQFQLLSRKTAGRPSVYHRRGGGLHQGASAGAALAGG
jgi:hypothetical protein